MNSAEPVLSFVVTTFNRPETAHAAVRSILDAGVEVPAEVIVVDDGSAADEASRLHSLLGGIDRVRIVSQHNAGLGAARVLGAASSSGSWLAFLDDDDEVLPGWAVLADLMDEGAGIVSGAARLQRPDGTHIRTHRPTELGPLYANLCAQYLAGSFAVRRDLYERAGGYLPGLSSSHQSELFIRLAAICTADPGLEVRTTDEPVVAIQRRDESDRALSDPRLLHDGTRWILARHAQAFSSDRAERSNWEAVAAVTAAKLGYPSARRYALRSLRSDPTRARSWLRLLAASSPLGPSRWKHASGTQRVRGSQGSPLAHAVGLRGTAAAELCAGSDLLFLPWRYEENPPASADSEGAPFWAEGTGGNDVRYQDPVYRWARRLLRRAPASVLDVGCGSGHKLVRHVAPEASIWWGVDQPSAIDIAAREFPDGNWIASDLAHADTWDRLSALEPDLVICADVIEHVVDPVELLERLAATAGRSGQVLLSTPDRSRLEGVCALGPPRNERHVREWNEEELRLLVEAAGLEVVAARHLLPRAYSPSAVDVRRSAYRLLHRKAIPDRRSSMALLLRVACGEPMGTGAEGHEQRRAGGHG